jgi:hypothetical protein
VGHGNVLSGLWLNHGLGAAGFRSDQLRDPASLVAGGIHVPFAQVHFRTNGRPSIRSMVAEVRSSPSSADEPHTVLPYTVPSASGLSKVGLRTEPAVHCE